jgi:dihydroorotate dehydrogenase (NAD+) catalytic subunit
LLLKATKSPALLNASGCLDALVAPEVARSFDAFVTKTITPEPREGNPPVRIAETGAGMLNSIGLANPGRKRFLAETLPRLRELGVPLWVSVGGFSAAEYAETCAALEDVTIELNLSCPNVDEAPEGAAEIVAACRSATGLPLYAKLSPAAWDIAEIARAVEAAGADGLSLVNTLRGLALDEQTLRPKLGRGTGGYSGPALKPVALACVYACAAAVELPIVGMGGVQSGLDALELIAAGASAVALGTILFSDPDAAGRVRSELAAEAASRGLADGLAARGLAHSSLQISDSSFDNSTGKDLESEQNLSLDRGGEAASIPRS